MPPNTDVHWPIGVRPARFEGEGAHRVTIRLDRRALQALQTLCRSRRDGLRHQGKTVEVRDRSQVIREVLAAYQNQDCPVRWDAFAFCCFEAKISLDPATFAILNRLAALPHFAGSRSAALRAVLVYAVEPPVVPRASGYRASYGYGSTSSRYRESYAERSDYFWPELQHIR